MIKFLNVFMICVIVLMIQGCASTGMSNQNTMLDRCEPLPDLKDGTKLGVYQYIIDLKGMYTVCDIKVQELSKINKKAL